MVFARALTRRTEKGRHYGALTAKFLSVLGAILYGFHNCRDGRCFPSYETIAERADCSRTTVYSAIRALELAGVLSWVNRIVRIREWGPDLFGRARNRVRVIRTSNAYTFVDPQPCAKPPDPSTFKFPTGTTTQDLAVETSCSLPRAHEALNPENRLHQALLRLGSAVGAAPGGAAKGLATK